MFSTVRSQSFDRIWFVDLLALLPLFAIFLKIWNPLKIYAVLSLFQSIMLMILLQDWSKVLVLELSLCCTNSG